MRPGDPAATIPFLHLVRQEGAEVGKQERRARRRMRRATTVDDLLGGARARIDRVAPQQVLGAIEEGAVVVDLRCPDERLRTGMIPGSIPIARSVLEWRADPASPWRDDRIARPDLRVLLLCEQGYSSSLAASTLRELGFHRSGDVIGGMEAWLAHGLPVVPPRTA